MSLARRAPAAAITASFARIVNVRRSPAGSNGIASAVSARIADTSVCHRRIIGSCLCRSTAGHEFSQSNAQAGFQSLDQAASFDLRGGFGCGGTPLVSASRRWPGWEHHCHNSCWISIGTANSRCSMPDYRCTESARRIVAQLFDLDSFTVIRKFGRASTWSRGENV